MDTFASAIEDRRRTVHTVRAMHDVPWADFFNRPAYFQYHTRSQRGCYFQLLDRETARVLAVAHCTEKEPGVFASPFRGTYGGIDTKEHDVLLFDIFVEDIERELRLMRAKKIQFALAPEAHDPLRHHLLLNTLLRHNYQIAKQDINYHLSVDATPLPEKMERNNQKRVRKCDREGCSFHYVQDPKEIEIIYDVIRKNRESKGYPVTMTLEHMLEMKTLFPDVWQFFGTKLKDQFIAGSVCIRINPSVLYVFYWGDLPEARTLSPVAFHANHLYDYCRTEHVSLLDIGTSTDNGVPNLGLMNFKQRLGCKTSMKFVCAKELS